MAKRWFLALSTEQRSGVSSFCGFRSENPCAGMLGQVGLSSPSEKQLKIEAEVVALPKDKLAKYCDESFPAPHCDTPLVVAFEGQPVEFEPARGAQFAFVPGDPAATDWPTATTPWLAIDRDGDGAITSGAELFGSSTMLAGGRLAHDGFAALAALDDNGDGSIDARDSMFQRLVLWSDRDGDHRSTPDELRALGSTVTSISLTFTRDARCNERDDCEGERGTLHWRDTAGIDHVGAIIDVYIPRRP